MLNTLSWYNLYFSKYHRKCFNFYFSKWVCLWICLHYNLIFFISPKILYLPYRFSQETESITNLNVFNSRVSCYNSYVYYYSSSNGSSRSDLSFQVALVILSYSLNIHVPSTRQKTKLSSILHVWRELGQYYLIICLKTNLYLVL